MENIRIDISALIEAVNDYLYATEEFKRFIKDWKSGWWDDLTAKERENYTKYDERDTAARNALRLVCKLISVDVDAAIAAVKAINRYEKNKGKYDRNVSIYPISPYCETSGERLMRAISEKSEDEWNGYYRSTGRKMSA